MFATVGFYLYRLYNLQVIYGSSPNIVVTTAERPASFAARVGRGLLWNYIGRMAEFLLRFVLFTLLARGLGKTGYGGYSYVLSIFGIAGLAAGLGLEQTLNTFTAQWQARPSELRYLLRRMLAIRTAALCVLAGGVWLFAPTLGRRVGLEAGSIRAMLLYLIAFNVYNLLLYYLVGRLEVGFAAFVRVAVMLLNVGLVWAMLRSGAGLAAIFEVQGATALLALVAALWRLRADLLGPSEPAPLGRPLRFAAVLGVTSGLNFVLGQQSDVFMLGLLLHDRAEIGAYNLAASLNFTLSTALLIGFEGVTQSAFSEVAARNAGRLQSLWVILLKLVSVLSVPALVFGALHAAKLVALFGGSYADSTRLLQVYLLFSTAGRLLGGGLNTTALYALGRERTPLIIRLASGGLNLMLAVILIRSLGPLGAVIATGISVLGTGLVETAITMHATGAAYPWRFAFKVILATTVAVAASYPLTGGGWLGLAAGAFVTGAVLLVVLALLRPLGPEERGLAQRLMPRLAPVLRYF